MDMEIEGEQAVVKDEDLFKAAENGDSSIFEALSHQQLLKSLSLRNEDRRSLLHVAASSSRSAVVKILSAADPSVSGINSPDEEGWVPLHSAASIGNVEIVEILLSRGEYFVDRSSRRGFMYICHAIPKSTLQTSEFLLFSWADVNLKNDGGRTALHYAASKGNSELCELLIEEGAEIDATDRAGQTPLMNAVICENKEVALLLIRHGADVDVEDKEGYTILVSCSNLVRLHMVNLAEITME
ncbi:hypothetical protein RHSIM_Rhsim12G0134100 [Rhododendron simsii]|uniref:Ankyrin repeat family protein n=1 Tax=Rhododendron simsii TaxID=118357 RepID=A0A834G5M2_RHOSS|nr:hypothetical protein RHSIM_Rhsim12G0134100 [Rhododendron simsii]